MPRVTDHPFVVESSERFSALYGEAVAGEVFETSDLVLSGFLLAIGYDADCVVWNDGRCHWFFHPQSPEASRDIREVVQDYYGGEASVEPKAFHLSTNTCRAAMNEAKPRRR